MLSHMWLDTYMNTNTNRTNTVTLTDGSQVTFTFRNTTVGWVNALTRRGVDPRQVVECVEGLPESARVAL